MLAQGTTVAFMADRISPALIAELMPLLQAHYAEVAHYDFPLDVWWEQYQKIAENGNLRVYTARIDGVLVGYEAFFLSRSLHYKSALFAQEDVLFVEKNARGARIGIGLMQFAHESLKAAGVTAVYHHCKAKADLNLGPLYRRIGLAHVDEVWSKRLDGG